MTSEELKFTSKPFIQADQVTRNGNIYPREVIEKAIDEARPRIEQGLLLGELGPSDGSPPSLHNASHQVINMKLDETGDMIVTVNVLDTPAGRKLRDMLQAAFLSGKKTVTMSASPIGTGMLEEVEMPDQVKSDASDHQPKKIYKVTNYKLEAINLTKVEE